MFLVIAFLVFHVANAAIPRACSTPSTSKYPFCNPKLPLDTRIRDLISRIHLEEKGTLLTARASPHNNISRIGLPEYDWGLNCIHGVQSRCGTNCATSFALPNAMGASFNFSLVRQMGKIMGTEMRALWLEGAGENHGNNLPHMGLDCWSPTININRDPRWGRNYEVPSEDPMLNGIFGEEYSLGLQNGVDKRFLQGIATLKHFDAYSLENYKGMDRHHFNAKVSPYMLGDTYFPAFKRTIIKGQAKGVMCSYNSVNGVPSCANNFLLNETLRQAWGFDGYVTSDSGAIRDIYADHKYAPDAGAATADGLRAGCDIDSGGPYQESITSIVQKKQLPESFVDEALYHTLGLRFRLGLFDPIDDQPYWHVPPSAVNTRESQAFNLMATQQSAVLLKNKNNVLPLPTNKKIALIGPHIDSQKDLLASYLGEICHNESFSCVETIQNAVTTKLGSNNVAAAKGCQDILCSSTSQFSQAEDAAKSADFVVMVMGLSTGAVEREGRDRVTIGLPGHQGDLITTIAKIGKPTALVLINGGIVALDGLENNVDSILEIFYPGFQGAAALTSILFGEFNPGGKMPVTMYNSSILSEDFFDMDITNGLGRTYKYYRGTPTFPFGYGLSYTTFTLSHKSTGNIPGGMKYSFDLMNTGNRDGHETIMAFFTPIGMDSKQPASRLVKKLFDFKKVFLTAGGKIQMDFMVTNSSVTVTDVNGKDAVFPGKYELLFTNGVSERYTDMFIVKA